MLQTHPCLLTGHIQHNENDIVHWLSCPVTPTGRTSLKKSFSVFWGQSQDCNFRLSRYLPYLPSVNWNEFSLENFIIALEVTGSMRVLQNQSLWASCGHWVRSGQSDLHEQGFKDTGRKGAFCMRQHRHGPQVTRKTIFYLHYLVPAAVQILWKQSSLF